ncbi:MAG TPA: hypothetical protein VMY37_29120 [Thermoguttaceae bacterium]|nr:hypothetical protein [Thermoguttaceae bacterium]
MRRNWTRACWVALLVLTIQADLALAVDTSETLLPATTKGFVSITNVDQLSEQWDKTQLGQLSKDPVMKPFADDLRRQAADRLWDLRRRLGASLDDLDGLAGGGASVGLIQRAEGGSAVALLVDVTDHPEEAQAFLKKVSQNMAEQKAKQTSIEVRGVPATLFELPKAEDAAEDEPPPQTIYVLKGDLLAGADDLDVIKGILGRVAGDAGDTLAELPAFRAIMDRCQKDAGDEVPQVRWFIEPFGYSKAAREDTPEKERPRGRTLLDQLEAAGFSAIQAVGGFVDVAVDRYELVHRTAVYAPKPHEKSMKMMVFPNTARSSPPAWIPRDVATYTVLYCDLLNAFDNFGPLFEQMAADGVEGIWLDTLEGLKTDEDGPQIDYREELFQHLDTELIAVTDYELPITTTSERLLYALKVKDVDAVKKALEKTQSVNEEARRREFQGHVIWETVLREKAKVQKVQLDLPPLGFGREDEGLEETAPPPLPNMALSVAHGYLLIASHYDFLVRMLEPIDERETLGRSIDFRIVDTLLQRLAPEQNCVRGFSRTDEEYRPTYELLRQGKMPESESMLGRALNDLLGPDPDTTRKQEIDASKAPDFDFVRRHLGPAGTFAVSEEDGWFFKGIMVSKEAE